MHLLKKIQEKARMARQSAPAQPSASRAAGQTWEAGLAAWPAFKEGIEARATAIYEANPEKRRQLMMDSLGTLPPFLRDIVLFRLCKDPKYNLREDADRIAQEFYGSTPEEMLPDLEIAMSYFWAMENMLHAIKLLHENPDNLAQKKHKEEAVAKMLELDNTMTPRQAELVKTHLGKSSLLTGQYYKINCTRTLDEWKNRLLPGQLADEFWAQYGKDAKYRAGYALALDAKKDELLPAPFECLGFKGPNWENGGIAFRIEKRCFASETPLLWYRDDANWSDESWKCFLNLSSGLDEVKRDGHTITFRLNPSKEKNFFIDQGHMIPMNQIGPCLFVRAGSRDFGCTFGEIADGNMIELAKFNI